MTNTKTINTLAIGFPNKYNPARMTFSYIATPGKYDYTYKGWTYAYKQFRFV